MRFTRFNSDHLASALLIGMLAICFVIPAFSAPPDQRLMSVHQGSGASGQIISPWQTDNVTWLITTNAGRPFGRASGGIIGDYFYVFGSMDVSIAQAYNWSTEHWQTVSEAPLGNCNWCGVSTGSDIYLIGRYAAYTFGNEVQKFTQVAGGPDGTWSTVADYPLTAAGIAADWDGSNYIYAAGGSDLVEVFDNAYRYDISGDEWTEIASLPIPMTYHGGAFLDGRFHVVGGVEGGGIAHYAYDPGGDEWTQSADLPTPNYFALFNLSASDDYLLSIGGGGGYGEWPATNAVQLYDPDDDEWFQETPTPAARGLNTAEWTPSGEVINTGGFYEWIYFQQAWIGSGFPGGSSWSAVSGCESSLKPDDFQFYPAAPNPFNPETVLSFRIAAEGRATLVIYDSGGREIARLLDRDFTAGLHSVSCSFAGNSSGLYFARLTAGDNYLCQKLVYVK